MSPASSPAAGIAVEVHVDDPAAPIRVALTLPAGATVAEALVAADAHRFLEAVAAGAAGLAIHGRRADPNARLHDGDRIEVLRPLQLDPKAARMRRAALRRR